MSFKTDKTWNYHIISLQGLSYRITWIMVISPSKIHLLQIPTTIRPAKQKKLLCLTTCEVRASEENYQCSTAVSSDPQVRLTEHSQKVTH